VLVSDAELAERVLLRLSWRWSPHAIAKSLTVDGGVSVCAETIYQACYRGTGIFGGATKWLATHRGRRRPRGRGRSKSSNVLGAIRNVTERPAGGTDRSEAGHWEGDLIKGAFNRSGVVTLVERQSRYTLLGRLANGCDADTTRRALTSLFSLVPARLRRSLTWDQGREMADWARLQDELDLPVFFCDPHSPWQRPTNEQTNGLLRRWLPKGTDLSIHSQTGLDLIAFKLNTMPRQLHNWTSANDQYNLLLCCNNH
jgi:IS30 family transposase